MLPLLSPYFKGDRGLLDPIPVNSVDEGQGTPLMSRQLIVGPLLMAEAAIQGGNCTSGAILGVQYLAQGYFDM